MKRKAGEACHHNAKSLLHPSPFAKQGQKNHLRLGISRAGIVEMLDRLGVYFCNLAGKGHYSASYVRSSEDAWIAEKYGRFNPDANRMVGELHCMTGYDLCSVTKQWLIAQGKSDLSLCELLELEKSPHVKPATVFYSHMQSNGIDSTLRSMKNACRDHAASLPPPDEQFFWLDYFSLRQAVKGGDFDVHAIRQIIQDIGITVAELDYHLGYSRRTFCIFEAWASIHSGATFLCDTFPQTATVLLGGVNPYDSEDDIDHDPMPIDSKSATTRYPQDKNAIDALIQTTVGFQELDRVVTAGILQSHCQQFRSGRMTRSVSWLGFL
jgi:hypothetical protein